ncbi:MAG: transcriptional regulator GlxA family with amidase domain [bacterium]|jgi:transcriptional regulator GlxA family with amidase domain
MKKVSLLAFDYAFSSVITGMIDIFSLVGVTWNRVQGIPIQEHFQVEIVALDTKPVSCLNNVLIQPHKSIYDVNKTDLILIPPIGANIEQTLRLQKDLIPWLQYQHENGAQIASTCTGAFLLAETGLLDGKQATTHWGYIQQFRKRYPDILLKPEQLITNEMDLFCAGGGSAWIDLGLFFIERHCGNEIAVQTAKSLVLDRERKSQSPYSTIVGQQYHQDQEILLVQKWMDEHLADQFTLEQLAPQFGMSSRTFKRRFKAATGNPALLYLQTLRVESAKKLLESTQLSVEDITTQVGYEDSSSFMKLFKKMTGISPNAYRKKFKNAWSLEG